MEEEDFTLALLEEGAGVLAYDPDGIAEEESLFRSISEMNQLIVDRATDIKQKCEFIDSQLRILGPRVLNAGSRRGWTALCCAACTGDLELVKWLLERGAELNTGNIVNMTPLFLAVRNRHYSIAKFLLEQGAEVNEATKLWSKDSDAGATHAGETPLHAAAKNVDVEMIDLLLAYGANPKSVAGLQEALFGGKGFTALERIEQFMKVPEGDDLRVHYWDAETNREKVWNKMSKELRERLSEFGVAKVNMDDCQLVCGVLKAGGLRKYYHQALAPIFRQGYEKNAPIRHLSNTVEVHEDLIQDILGLLAKPHKGIKQTKEMPKSKGL